MDQDSGITGELRSVSFIDKNNGFIVGGYTNSRGIIYRTTDGGGTWIRKDNEITGILNSVYFTDKNNGFIVGHGMFEGIILRSTDGGNNWLKQNSGTSVYLKNVFFSDANIGIIVGDGGTILKTTNGGNNWERQVSGTSNNLTGVFFVDANTGITVGDGGTIIKTTNGGITFIENETELIQLIDFLLSQNYPNPFNPTTKINYTIPQTSFITLKVYDVLGKEIATLVDEEKPAGNYEIDFDASNLASGIYIYQLKAGDFISSKKMLLLK